MSFSEINTDRLRKRTFITGSFIIREGEIGNCAYLIQFGIVEVLINTSDKPLKICEYGPGELIGEMAMIDHLPRTASIRALTTCELIEISHNDFTHRLKIADPILNQVMKLILKRYRELLSKSSDASLAINDYKNVCEQNVSEKVQQNTEIIDTFTKSYEIQEAIKNNELIFYYQPIVSSQTKKIAGFEALVRWLHPKKGMIFPDEFIPLCENNGLITDITFKAIEQVAIDYERFQSVAKPSTTEEKFFISINLSVADIENQVLLRKLEDSPFRSDSNSRLHIEIVESIFIEKPEVAKNFINQCREMGISISLDDFGTGYSSLSYLQEFEFNTLKIDRKFVSTMLSNKKSMLLIKMIVGLAQKLNLEIIAEGVETEEEYEAIKAMGIECIQGYYFSKPIPFKLASEFLINGVV